MANKCKDCELFTTDCWEVEPGIFTSYGHFGPEKGLMGKCLRDGEVPDSERRPFEEQMACEEFQQKVGPEAPW